MTATYDSRSFAVVLSRQNAQDIRDWLHAWLTHDA
jgi:hypothetical protein